VAHPGITISLDVGQYNSSSTMFPYQNCTCVLSQMSKPTVQCKLITVSDYTAAKTIGELHKFSLHDINNGFKSISFGDLHHGIFESVPTKMLHVSGNGIKWHHAIPAQCHQQHYICWIKQTVLCTSLTYFTKTLSNALDYRSNMTCPIHQIIMASQMEPKCCDIMCYAY